MKEIERYIEFAIENWYRRDLLNPEIRLFTYTCSLLLDCRLKWNIELNLIQEITSKEFIEAIARGLIDFQSKGMFGDTYNLDFDDRVRYITFEQAIAIRDNKLEDFITNLLWTDTK